MRAVVLAMLLALTISASAGCGKGPPESTSSASAKAASAASATIWGDTLTSTTFGGYTAPPPSARVAIDLERPTTWTRLELARVTVTLGGMEGHYKDARVSLLVPTNFELDDSNGPTERQYKPKNWQNDDHPMPWITVRHTFGPPAFDREFATFTASGDVKVVSKKKEDKGWVIALEDTFTLNVHTAIALRDDESVECQGHAFGQEAKDAKDALVPWFEKICRSITVE